MGSPLAPIIAEVMMQKVQDQAFASLPKHQQPVLFCRYVDDCFVVCDSTHAQLILDSLNSQHKDIQLTMDSPRPNGSIDFLDLTINPLHHEDGKMSFSTIVFRKKTRSSHLLPFPSNHLFLAKEGIASFPLHRASTHCSNLVSLAEEHQKISDNFK